MLKATIDDVPHELVKLVPVVQLAATVSYSHTRKERIDALTAAAITLGSENRVAAYCSDEHASPATRKIAQQIFESIHPEALSWGLVIKIPWNRRSMKDAAITIAEDSLCKVWNGRQILNNEELLILCRGCGRLLADAEDNLGDIGPRVHHLLKCLAQIDSAWQKKDFSTNIDYDYDFGNKLDDKQGVFDFYE